MERYIPKKRRDYWLLWDAEENRKASPYKYDSLLQCKSVADRWNKDLEDKQKEQEVEDEETSSD